MDFFIQLQNLIIILLDFMCSINIIVFIILLIVFYHVLLFLVRDKKYIKAFKKFNDPDKISIEDLKEIPLINIIIPAWKEDKIFENCLESITKLNYPRVKAIIIAGGSEETIRIAKSFKKYDNFIILNQEGGGKLKAINECFIYVTEGIIYLVDADVIFSDEIILRMIYPIINQKENVVIGGTRPLKSQENKDLIKYLRINRDLNFSNKFSRYRKTHISGANTCMHYQVIKSIKKFSEDKIYAVEMSQAEDIISKGYKIYRLVDFRGRIYTRSPETIREWVKQRIRWNENSIFHALQKDKKKLLRILILFLFSIYLIIFPFLFLIHISFVIIGLLFLLYLYLKKVRKVIFNKIIHKNYFKKINVLFFFKMIIYMYLEILVNIYIVFEILLLGDKRLKARKYLSLDAI